MYRIVAIITLDNTFVIPFKSITREALNSGSDVLDTREMIADNGAYATFSTCCIRIAEKLKRMARIVPHGAVCGGKCGGQ